MGNHANLTYVGDQDFESKVLKSDAPVVVDFWAVIIFKGGAEVGRVVGADRNRLKRELDRVAAESGLV